MNTIRVSCQTVSIQIRADVLSGLIWIQTVCNGYQQMALADTALNVHAQHFNGSTGLLFGLSLYLLPYSKTCLKRPLSKRPKIGFQDQLSLNAGQKYCRMLRGEHSTILSTFIKLSFVIKIFILVILSGCFKQVLLYLQVVLALRQECVLTDACLSLHCSPI